MSEGGGSQGLKYLVTRGRNEEVARGEKFKESWEKELGKRSQNNKRVKRSKNKQKKQQKKSKKRRIPLIFAWRHYHLEAIYFQIVFLDASTHLYKRVCPSFRRSVRQ